MSSCMAGPSGANEDNVRSNMVTSSGYSYFEQNPSEIYNMNPHMEMVGFPIMDSSLSSWSQNNQIQEDPSNNMNMMRSSSSSSYVLFPCEGNERPSQGLSLSLSSSNPSTIGLQSFELRPHVDDFRFGPSSTSIQQEHPHMIKYSKYLCPAQELLNEYCNLGDQNTNDNKMKKVILQSDESGVNKLPISPHDLLDLQRRKAKLFLMLEEVDRRYKHYSDQMKTVVSSFESVAGNGAATVYSALASKAMSRHFRCLRDGIVNQIKTIKKAMGEKDGLSPGTSKGETPRLRVLDQTLRQQKAYQQMTMTESHPWRPQRGLPERSVSVLRAWLFEHFLHPYPSDVDKHILARQTGLSRSQVSNWFINARVRLWKPMVEEMYIEELKDQEDLTGDDPDNENYQTQEHNNQNTSNRNEDLKPTHEQLVRIDSECLSSIINNNPGKNNGGTDFSQYNAGGGGVSLTLGLHQHGGNGGISLAFSPSSHGSLFQYSMLDGESQTLPYRNLMGAQLLHDLAG